MVFKISLIAILAISAVTFLAYAEDKRRAVRGRWRIKESTLLSLSFFGGAVGGILAMLLFRHKTRHVYFTLINLLGLIWQVALIIATGILKI